MSDRSIPANSSSSSSSSSSTPTPKMEFDSGSTSKSLKTHPNLPTDPVLSSAQATTSTCDPRTSATLSVQKQDEGDGHGGDGSGPSGSNTITLKTGPVTTPPPNKSSPFNNLSPMTGGQNPAVPATPASAAKSHLTSQAPLLSSSDILSLTKNPSDVDLDWMSKVHLKRLIHKTLENVGIIPSPNDRGKAMGTGAGAGGGGYGILGWTTALMSGAGDEEAERKRNGAEWEDALYDLLVSSLLPVLTPQAIESLAETKTALRHANRILCQRQEASRQQSSNKAKSKPKDDKAKDKDKAKGKSKVGQERERDARLVSGSEFSDAGDSKKEGSLYAENASTSSSASTGQTTPENEKTQTKRNVSMNLDEEARNKVRERKQRRKTQREMAVEWLTNSKASRAASTISLPNVVDQTAGSSSMAMHDAKEHLASSGTTSPEPLSSSSTTFIPSHPRIKLTEFRIHLKTEASDTRGRDGQIGSSIRGMDLSIDRASFMDGRWVGKRLFDRDDEIDFSDGESDDDDDSDDEGSAFADRIGGTIVLRGAVKDLKKLEKIIELLVFAACHLKLEIHVVHDLHCPRPSPPPPPQPVLQPTTSRPSTSDSDSKDLPSSSSEAGELTMSTSRPSIDSVVSRKGLGLGALGHKKVWSRHSLWNLLLGNKEPNDEASEREDGEGDGGGSKPADLKKGIYKLGDKMKLHHHGRRFRHRSGQTGSGSVSESEGSNGNRASLDDVPWEVVTSDRKGKGGGMKREREGAMTTEAGRDSGRDEAKKEAEEEVKERRPEPEDVVQMQDADSTDEPTERFARVIKRMEKALLSVSPFVHFPPPHLLLRLRQQESQACESGDAVAERPFLNRLRSYASVDAETLAVGFAEGVHGGPSQTGTPASSMSKATGRITINARAGLASLMTNNDSLEGTLRHQSLQFLRERSSLYASPSQPPCEKPRWVTIPYYVQLEEDRADRMSCGSDATLGGWVDLLVENKDRKCESCGRPAKDHESSWIHNVTKISITVKDDGEKVEDPDTDSQGLVMWARCKQCSQRTTPVLASSATSLLSTGKFFEMVIYDEKFIPSDLTCEHVVEDVHNLIHCFQKGSSVVQLVTEHVDLFEMRLPMAVDSDVDQSGPLSDARKSGAPAIDGSSQILEKLRLEVSYFYGSLQERISVLEGWFDSQYFDPAVVKTSIKPPDSNGAHPSEASDGSGAHSQSEGAPGEVRAQPYSAAPLPDHPANVHSEETLKVRSPRQLLQRLQQAFSNDEVDVKALVEQASPLSMNAARRVLLDRAKGAKARLMAWEQKHLSPESRKLIPEPRFVEPEYAAKDCHVMAADNSVIVREDEPSSWIAFTLSSDDYKEELASLMCKPSRRASAQTSSSMVSTPASSRRTSRQILPDEPQRSRVPSMAGSPDPHAGAHAEGAKTGEQPDPDDLDRDFHIADTFVAEAKPKKILKQATSLLSLRGLSRQRSADAFNLFGLRSVSAGERTPTSEVDDLSDFGSLRIKTAVDDDKVLEELISCADSSSPVKSSSSNTGSTLGRRTPSATSSYSVASASTIEAEIQHSRDSSGDSDDTVVTTITSNGQLQPGALADIKPAAGESHERGSSIISGPLSAIWNLGSLRGLRPPDSSGGGRLTPDPEGPSPHIKYNFRHGNKKFSVTVHYAEKFEALRRKCGLSEEMFTESLARCKAWAATGGKSKSTFYMTQDGRFILKQMISAWNIGSEKDALLAFAPQMFDYLLDRPNQRPSLLTKIFGFYTLKMKDFNTGEILQKLDVVVMENLLYGQTITRKFDLKGISSRVAKAKKAEMDATLWDADWVEGSFQTLLRILPHSKQIIRDAIASDTEFLSQANVMDYSLLVGVDDTRRELVVGLIDTIGTFNLAKLVESKGKQALKAGALKTEVTVLPPAEYAARFRTAMETYFVAVPEKFSRMPDEADNAPEPCPRLASVL